MFPVEYENQLKKKKMSLFLLSTESGEDYTYGILKTKPFVLGQRA